MINKSGLVSKNIKETEKIAKLFLDDVLKGSNKFQGATVVGLSGNLGAGKTAFVKAVARHLRIKSKVSSPTFVIFKKYSLKNFGSYKFLFHVDAYRLQNEKELFHLGWEEIVDNKEHLVFVEWPENVVRALPKKHHKIYISHTKEEYRKFKIKNA